MMTTFGEISFSKQLESVAIKKIILYFIFNRRIFKLNIRNNRKSSKIQKSAKTELEQK